MAIAQSGAAGTAATRAGPTTGLSQAALAFAARRKLSRGTLERLGVVSGTAFFPDIKQTTEAIFFMFRQGWKARSITHKTFVAGGGYKQAFFNEAAVLESGSPRVFITEGELDAAALVEAGVPADEVLSVPNGAVERVAESDVDVRGYGYVDAALKAGLNKKRKFVWCGDADAPGQSLRADMSRVIGTAYFWFVDWPEGANDANAVLMSDGAQDLRERVEDGARQWPIDGAYRLSEIPEPPPMTLWHPGFPQWENKILLGSRTLSVVTGHGGHGKTQLWTQIWYQVAREYGVPVCTASFETAAKPHIRRYLRQLITGNRESVIDADGLRRADKWIEDHYLFLIHPERRPTIAWLLDRFTAARLRYGHRIFVIDPWNRVEGARERGESETDYVSRVLRELYAFAVDMDCHVQVVAHPSKMDPRRRGQPPSLEDISGSKHWENMVDHGFVVHRPKVFEAGVRHTEATLVCRKARYEELGHECQLWLNYDLATGRYRSTDYEVTR